MDSKQDNRFICGLLWDHLSIHPHGHISPCCEVDWEYPGAFARNKNAEGKYTETVVNIAEGIDKAINSDTFKEIRKKMLSGDVPDACKTCHRVEQAGGVSKRFREAEHSVPKDYDNITAEDGSINTSLENVELRLGNYCNLKCRSCNAESSTSWIDDYYKLKNKVPLPSSYDKISKAKDSNYEWVENEEFYNELFNYSPNLRLLQISGGEPFLVDKHTKLLDLIIKSDKAKEVTISYVTNVNYNFEKIKPILDRLKNFKFVNISFSVDDVDKRNTFIRSLSNWDVTMKNIQNYIANYDFHYSITQTINAYNFLYVEKLTNVLVGMGIFKFDGTGPIRYINHNHVMTPDYQSANILPLEVRRQKLDSIKGLVDPNYYEALYRNYYNTEANGKHKLFYDVTTEVDKVRRENVHDIFPELMSVIKNMLKENII